MCYNCGCGIPHDDMGDIDNVTSETFGEIAEQRNITAKEAKEEVYEYLTKQLNGYEVEDGFIEEVFAKAANAWGQSLEDAKKQTHSMLKMELVDDEKLTA